MLLLLLLVEWLLDLPDVLHGPVGWLQGGRCLSTGGRIVGTLLPYHFLLLLLGGLGGGREGGLSEELMARSHGGSSGGTGVLGRWCE